jgi:MFS family permease
VINAFDMPARQSFLREMIEDRADLPNAIALNSSVVNVAKLAGPAIAAVLVVAVGEALCFAIDAASYVAVIASLLAIRVVKVPPRVRTTSVRAELVEGIRYAGNMPLVRSILVLLAACSFLGGAYGSLLPIVAAEHLQGGPYTLGILMSSAGVGALTGALYLASRSSIVGLGTVIARCALGLGAGLVALELATSVWIAAPILFVVGLCLMVQLAATNTIVQTIVDPEKLGRVMSLYAVAFSGAMPIGAFLEGLLASQIGALHTFAVAGLGCIVAGLAFRHALPRLRTVTRPLYVELGLIRSA